MFDFGDDVDRVVCTSDPDGNSIVCKLYKADKEVGKVSLKTSENGPFEFETDNIQALRKLLKTLR